MIREEEDGQRVTFFISGKLDAETSPDLEAKIRGVSIAKTEIVFDFAELEYVSSMGLRVVLQAYKLMKTRGGKFKVQNIPDAVKSVFEMTGFMKTFERDEKLVIVQKLKNNQGAAFSLVGVLDESTMETVSKDLSAAKLGNIKNLSLDCDKLVDITPEGCKALQEVQLHLKDCKMQLLHTAEPVSKKIFEAGAVDLLPKEAAALYVPTPDTAAGGNPGVGILGATASYVCTKEWEVLSLPFFKDEWYQQHPEVKHINLDFTPIPTLSADAFFQITVMKKAADKWGVKVNAMM
jgi:anti-sigma B factor antagonist